MYVGGVVSGLLVGGMLSLPNENEVTNLHALKTFPFLIP
jgi:hypothetical protein